jgi:hypothetical protein
MDATIAGKVFTVSEAIGKAIGLGGEEVRLAGQVFVNRADDTVHLTEAGNVWGRVATLKDSNLAIEVTGSAADQIRAMKQADGIRLTDVLLTGRLSRAAAPPAGGVPKFVLDPVTGALQLGAEPTLPARLTIAADAESVMRIELPRPVAMR